MKSTHLLVSMITIVCLSLLTPPSVIGQGNGQGGGKGGSGSGGGTGGSPDLGDLIVLYRYPNGVPILTPEGCQQALAAPGVSLPALGTSPACVPTSSTESCVIPVDPATCAIAVGYESYTQEVDFGRTSVIRSPGTVLQQQMDDVLVNLSTADCVTLDPAGRMVTSTVTDGTVSSAEIDSPLQNLSIYNQLMLTGYLGSATSPLALPAGPTITAARALGAAYDKTGKVNVDAVAYINQILGLTDSSITTLLPKNCISVREEVQGVVQTTQKCFLDYGAFTYNRTENFLGLPSPAYLPTSGPLAGWFEYLKVLDPTPTFSIGQGLILTTVPELLMPSPLPATNIGAFAQAADDSRAVIDFMHTWPVPGDYPTPLTCAPSGATHYDVSISSQSGLQVPVRMVSGTEGREFTVAIANAGPDAATGTVQVTAKDANGAFLPTFPRYYPFTLLPGAGQSWTEGFVVNAATTISWTATITAEFDVNPSNNTVTATTRVTGRGGQ